MPDDEYQIRPEAYSTDEYTIHPGDKAYFTRCGEADGPELDDEIVTYEGIAEIVIEMPAFRTSIGELIYGWDGWWIPEAEAKRSRDERER